MWIECDLTIVQNLHVIKNICCATVNAVNMQCRGEYTYILTFLQFITLNYWHTQLSKLYSRYKYTKKEPQIEQKCPCIQYIYISSSQCSGMPLITKSLIHFLALCKSLVVNWWDKRLLLCIVEALEFMTRLFNNLFSWLTLLKLLKLGFYPCTPWIICKSLAV